jgi:hypothetical protein
MSQSSREHQGLGFRRIGPAHKALHFGFQMLGRGRLVVHALAVSGTGDHLHRPGCIVTPGADPDVREATVAGGKKRCMPTQKTLGGERGFAAGGRIQHHLDDALDMAIHRCQRTDVHPEAGRDGRAHSVHVELLAFDFAGLDRLERLSLKDKAEGDIDVTCLIASEINVPEGTKPVVWCLLTNRQASTLEHAIQLINWDGARWEIELFLLILKEGCRVERLQLSDKDRLESALAIYMVIARRINRLMRLGRTVPELDAGLVFELDEWRAAFILNKKPVPKKMPTLNEVIRLIAQRGGFLGRKGDGEPGARTLWLGLQEIAIFVEGACYVREFSQAGT